MKILILIAGTNDPSNATTLASAFRKGIEQHPDVQVDSKRLKDMPLEHFHLGFYEGSAQEEEDFKALRTLVQQADGIVIATPIWNFGVPAHLKNFIDRMGSFALDPTHTTGTLNGKPFYLIFTGGAPATAWTGLMKKTTSALPQAIKYFGGSVIGTYFEGKCTPKKGEFGLVVDQRPESLRHVEEEGSAYTSTVREFAKTGKLPAKQTLTKHLYRWGQSLMKKM